MKRKNSISAGLWVSLGVVIIILMTGTLFYKFYEGLTWTDALYFTSMTVVTVGFGDVVPTRPFSRIFTIFFALISIPAILFCLGYLIESFLKIRIDKVEDRMDQVLREEREIVKEEKEIVAREESILKQLANKSNRK